MIVSSSWTTAGGDNHRGYQSGGEAAGRVTLTEAGAELLRHSKTILDQVAAATASVHRIEWLPAQDEDWRRALGVQAALWRSGQVRAVGFPGLLIAAVAERERVTVLHYDGDYDLIAKVTGQSVQWVVPRGTVP
jgi:predicted nucleic acid-binding protein